MKNYTIAKYIRLSIEDEKTESLSIPHQRLMLDRYIDALELPNTTILEFVDSGHTGTNMERPAVQELLELVRGGEVDCVAVKDFSRFSRNAMDSGYFIEQVFPLYQVRFISVADHFDSNDYKNDTGGIDIAFRFLMHEYYSRDLSNKVKSAKRIQMARGENITARTIYGYYKADSGKWEPDGIVSEVVRQIYDFALDGFSPAQIRDKLFAAHIPTPQEYYELGRGKEIAPACLWEARAVTRILTNEQYMGTYISGKQEQKAIGSSSKNWVDKSKWIVIPGSHTPIIQPEIFEQVQKIMRRYLTNEPTPKAVRHVQGDGGLQHEWINKLPYGYGKDENGQWCIDPASGAVVGRIFDLALQGIHEADIAQTLADEKHPTPKEFRQLSKGQNIEAACIWRAKGVRDILRDIQYSGAYVAGKFRQNDDGSSYRTHESEWRIVPNKIPAIISRAEFDAVAELIAGRGKRQLRPQEYLLRGNIVRCGCCDYAMSYNGGANPMFRCQHTAANPGADCHKLKVSAPALDDVVMTLIRKQAEVVLNTSNLSELRRLDTDDKRLEDAAKKIRQCTEERQQIYERFVRHEIDADTFKAQKHDCAAQLDRLNRQVELIKQAARDRQAGLKSAELAKHVLSDAATPRELVEALVDKVFVFPGNKIEIRWKVADFAST